MASRPEAADLRMPLLGSAGWLGGLAAALAPTPLVLGCALLVLCVLVLARGRLRAPVALTLAGAWLVFAAVAGSALVRQEAVTTSPVALLAEQRAAVTLSGRVVADPRWMTGPFGDQVLVRIEVDEVTGRGLTHRLATPLLVIGGDQWATVPLGARVSTSGRLSPSEGPDLAGVLASARDPVVLGRPDVWWRGAAAVRDSIRQAVSHRPPDQRALVPALVDGDDAGLDPALADDFVRPG